VIFLSFDPVELAYRHIRMQQRYEELLTEEQKQKALRDSHSKRKPRFCGLTVHFTVDGCPYRCSYCYTHDMGLSTKPRPNPLSPEELTYAILANRYFVSGRYGTLIAIGAISEPFIFPERAISYLQELSMLGNPIQFSTKSYLSSSYANEISRLPAPINPLVTIVTTDLVDILEPYAPSVDKRLETIRNLSSAGLKTCLFLRPIIVGVNYREAKNIMELAYESGAQCVIIGSFRITYRIYLQLKNLGLDLEEVERRINTKYLRKNPRKQHTIPLTTEEKRKLILLARKIGLTPFKSACCGNSSNANVICPSVCFETGFCTHCQNRCWERKRPELDAVREALRILGITAEIKKIIDSKLLVSTWEDDPVIQVLARRLIKH